MNLWLALMPLSGKTLTTLSASKPFDIVEINDKNIIIKPHSSGKNRPIKRSDFQEVFEKIHQDGSVTLKEIREVCEMSPVYIAAILVQLPNITFTNRPIRLTTINT